MTGVVAPPSRPARWLASAAGVGWSKVSVTGSDQPGLCGQGVAQFQGGQRVDAQVGEGPFGVQGGRVGVGQHGGGGGGHQGGQRLQLFVGGLHGELRGQGVGAGGGGGLRAGVGQPRQDRRQGLLACLAG